MTIQSLSRGTAANVDVQTTTFATSLDSALKTKSSAMTIRWSSGLSLRLSDGLPISADGRGRAIHFLLKRVMDLVLGSLALLLLAPLLVATAVAIRLTSQGPALFRQDRDGMNGTVISVYKFRSMYADRGDASGVQQTRAGDTRITPIGRFIRKTSIDELPQLLNVLSGHMSLVGPRPHPIGMLAGGVPYDVLVPYYHARHAMKPGITGWAQANGLRGPTVDAEAGRARVDHDIAYIQNFNVLLDIKIMIRTVLREFVTGNGQ